MRVLGSSIIFILSLSHMGFSQSKSEAVEWINTQGEETIQRLTGNISLYWELDEYGSFRVTDFNPEDKQLAQKYTYLNLYELDPKRTSIREKSNKSRNKILILSCRKEKGSCIKIRHDYRDSSLKSKESAIYAFLLESDYDGNEEEKLLKYLKWAIEFFNESSTVDGK
ncbi:hypothetical protein NC796_03120 [Aliifodinibius sp. S!AR15-10]|nr:hypothetical protein [Aliifodinibius sp. S!AR15-10]